MWCHNSIKCCYGTDYQENENLALHVKKKEKGCQPLVWWLKVYTVDPTCYNTTDRLSTNYSGLFSREGCRHRLPCRHSRCGNRAIGNDFSPYCVKTI